MTPLCFVLMPFGRKMDGLGRLADFDQVYLQIIAPAVKAAGLEPIRADEEQLGGSIHKPMFERLLLCDYAVADVTGANPNVYYELGVRHALRPRSTVILFAEGTTLPFDLAPLRGLAYSTDASGAPKNAAADLAALIERLKAARADSADDSPLFQLIADMPRVEIDRRKTDVFREKADYAKSYKDRLTTARAQGVDAVRAVAAEFDNWSEVESGIIVDLYLSYRAVKAHEDMVALYARMPRPLQRARMVREQLGFALNRLGRGDEAERVLREVIQEYGASSETNGLLGRVYKDRWEAAAKAGRAIEAKGLLKSAIETYAAGFEADWRDAYPGINAVTLMEMQDKPDSRQAEMLPVVRYAALRRARAGGDYWDHATLVELAVLARDREAAETHLADALALVREVWEPESSARNLGLVLEKRRARGEDCAWAETLITELNAAAGRLAKS